LRAVGGTSALLGYGFGYVRIITSGWVDGWRKGLYIYDDKGERKKEILIFFGF